MNRKELERRLLADGILPDAYDFIGDGQASETYVLRPEGNEWTVYYAERGLQTGKQLFPSEPQACEYFLDLLRRDPTTRQR